MTLIQTLCYVVALLYIKSNQDIIQFYHQRDCGERFLIFSNAHSIKLICNHICTIEQKYDWSYISHRKDFLYEQKNDHHQ